MLKRIRRWFTTEKRLQSEWEGRFSNLVNNVNKVSDEHKKIYTHAMNTIDRKDGEVKQRLDLIEACFAGQLDDFRQELKKRDLENLEGQK